ncbi:hypothetical protein GCM10007886_27080 [Methylobacterium gregans]|nr:hypothetical protein GCM10007886_27080 [Methylobacterium gregans]
MGGVDRAPEQPVTDGAAEACHWDARGNILLDLGAPGADGGHHAAHLSGDDRALICLGQVQKVTQERAWIGALDVERVELSRTDDRTLEVDTNFMHELRKRNVNSKPRFALQRLKEIGSRNRVSPPMIDVHPHRTSRIYRPNAHNELNAQRRQFEVGLYLEENLRMRVEYDLARPYHLDALDAKVGHASHGSGNPGHRPEDTVQSRLYGLARSGTEPIDSRYGIAVKRLQPHARSSQGHRVLSVPR